MDSDTFDDEKADRGVYQRRGLGRRGCGGLGRGGGRGTPGGRGLGMSQSSTALLYLMDGTSTVSAIRKP